MQPSTPTGRLMRKIQCQDAISTSQPPSVGPINGPIRPGMVTRLIAGRNSSRGKARNTISRPTGSSIAPPMPCSTRAATSNGRLGAAAQHAEPRVKVAMAPMKIGRVP